MPMRVCSESQLKVETYPKGMSHCQSSSGSSVMPASRIAAIPVFAQTAARSCSDIVAWLFDTFILESALTLALRARSVHPGAQPEPCDAGNTDESIGSTPPAMRMLAGLQALPPSALGS